MKMLKKKVHCRKALRPHHFVGVAVAFATAFVSSTVRGNVWEGSVGVVRNTVQLPYINGGSTIIKYSNIATDFWWPTRVATSWHVSLFVYLFFACQLHTQQPK